MLIVFSDEPCLITLAMFQWQHHPPLGPIQPVPKENRKLLIIPQVSSKFSERSKNYPRIADAIKKIVELKKGNYAFKISVDAIRGSPIRHGSRWIQNAVKNMEVNQFADILKDETLRQVR